jgi:hypothetical protein
MDTQLNGLRYKMIHETEEFLDQHLHLGPYVQVSPPQTTVAPLLWPIAGNGGRVRDLNYDGVGDVHPPLEPRR